MIARWSRKNGYRDVLAVSLPLVATMGAVTLMQFTDRIFLANHAMDAIAAALPAGLAAFACISFFMGIAGYTNTFVAQYTGAGAFHMVGAILWQGIYLSVFAALFLASLYFAAVPLFEIIGHSRALQELEVAYFRILILGAGLVVAGSTLACFYTGRGLTRTVMLVHFAGTAVNIPLDYCLIYGIGPVPAMGIRGAGIATVSASAVIVMILLVLIFRPDNRRRFGTWRYRGFDAALFRRLVRFGLPSGVQFFLEIFAFTFFIQMVGRLGDVQLAASNIVLSIESLSFMPLFGLHTGLTTLVGQAVGRQDPEQGAYATMSTLYIAMAYMVFLAFLFVCLPEPLLYLFTTSREASPEIMPMGRVLLRFVAVFCFFDAINLTFSGAVKGAGDTRFIMWTIGALSLGVMVLPAYLAVEVFQAGLYTAWLLMPLYVFSLAAAFWLRYRNGAWKKMRVIENRPGLPAAAVAVEMNTPA